jgi:hypothetical protein
MVAATPPELERLRGSWDVREGQRDRSTGVIPTVEQTVDGEPPHPVRSLCVWRPYRVLGWRRISPVSLSGIRVRNP